MPSRPGTWYRQRLLDRLRDAGIDPSRIWLAVILADDRTASSRLFTALASPLFDTPAELERQGCPVRSIKQAAATAEKVLEQSFQTVVELARLVPDRAEPPPAPPPEPEPALDADAIEDAPDSLTPPLS